MRESELDEDLELAIAASRAAGEVLLRHFGSGLEVSFKSADQPVTAADLEADAILRDMLTGSRPGYGWLSEEMDEPPTVRGGRVWVVDPLDGTGNFVKGRDEFAVCVGLWEDGRVILGVIFHPAADVVYHARAGGGAFRDGRPITTRPYPPAERLVTVASHGEVALGRLDPIIGEGGLVLVGSTALKMMRVAEGDADLYVSTTTKGVWDVCAGSLIVAEAGGQSADLAGNLLELEDLERSLEGLIVTGKDGAADIPRIASLVASSGGGSA